MNSRDASFAPTPHVQNASTPDESPARRKWPTRWLTGMRGRELTARIVRLPHLSFWKAALDTGLILLAGAWAWQVSFSQVVGAGAMWPFLSAVLVARLTVFCALGLHRSSWLHVSRFEVFRLVLSALLGSPLIAIIMFSLPDPFNLRPVVRPHLVLTTEMAFYLLAMFGARITARTLANGGAGDERRVLIVGAGQAGKMLAHQLQEGSEPYHAVGFVDDDPNLQRRRYRGVPILGTTHQMAELARHHHAQEIVIAITNLSPQRLRELLREAESAHLPIRFLPPLRELMGRKADASALREIRMEDLLPRPEVQLDKASIGAYLRGATVLVTGGGGSIGGELCRQALDTEPQHLLVLGRGENSVFEMVAELGEMRDERGLKCEIVPVICDVRDRSALAKVFERFAPQVVFHAAAHKHVPLMESFPCEAIKNNVLGTQNLVELAVASHVEHFVMVSTDKAVDPTSVMGATKRIGEMIVRAYAGEHGTNMVCVRFGNVLGSRGSVVPTMTRQIRRGKPVTVTDPDMVRYFMTIPEAVGLILQAGAVGGCGEVFILDMGHPVKILDLAHDLIRLCGLVPNQDIPVRVVGKRPGEKMWEDLLTRRELEGATKRGPFFVAEGERVNLRELQNKIAALIQIAQNNDDDASVRAIASVVPSFCGTHKAFALAESSPSQTPREVPAREDISAPNRTPRRVTSRRKAARNSNANGLQVLSGAPETR